MDKKGEKHWKGTVVVNVDDSEFSVTVRMTAPKSEGYTKAEAHEELLRASKKLFPTANSIRVTSMVLRVPGGFITPKRRRGKK